MSDDMDSHPRATRHPADVDLVAFADGELVGQAADEVRHHVAGCPDCSETLRDLDDPIEGDITDVVGELPEGIASLYSTEAWRDPQPEEIWHLEWDSDAALAVVLSAGDDGLEVAPVTAEGPGDAATVVVPAAESPLGVALFVWLGLRRPVPLGVFSRPGGSVRIDQDAPAAASAGPLTPDTAMLRAELAGVVDRFSAAAWAPSPAMAAGAVSLSQLLRDRNLKATELARAAGLQPADITALARGVREMSADEASRLAAALNVTPDTLRRPAVIPPALIRAVERPLHRLTIRLRALGENIGEAAMRLQVAHGVLAMPARTSAADRDAQTWDELVRHYLGD